MSSQTQGLLGATNSPGPDTDSGGQRDGVTASSWPNLATGHVTGQAVQSDLGRADWTLILPAVIRAFMN
jgi:hypothetical protein